MGIQLRHFYDTIAPAPNPAFDQPTSWKNGLSTSFKLDYSHRWDNDSQKITFTPFLRFDDKDGARTHADVRELMWKKSSADLEFNVGIGKVFWGVTEGQHLVDVINQNDQLEDIKGEEKLGQFMTRAGWRSDIGLLEMFLLTGFRERPLPGLESRPGVSLPLDKYAVRYESECEQWQPEYALRWSRRNGNLDLGVSYFNGANREPIIVPGATGAGGSRSPYVFYELMEQYSIDASYLWRDWTLKLEGINRHANSGNFHAEVYGVEKTFSEFSGKPWEITAYLEYNRDSRPHAAFQDDYFIGLRMALNDIESSEVKLGRMVDAHTGSSSLRIEGSSRLTDNWKLKFLGIYFDSQKTGDNLSPYKDDSFIQIELVRHW